MPSPALLLRSSLRYAKRFSSLPFLQTCCKFFPARLYCGDKAYNSLFRSNRLKNICSFRKSFYFPLPLLHFRFFAVLMVSYLVCFVKFILQFHHNIYVKQEIVNTFCSILLQKSIATMCFFACSMNYVFSFPPAVSFGSARSSPSGTPFPRHSRYIFK
mgnify:CR=1 FL=1